MPVAKPDPIRPIRSLLRGLDALAALGNEGLTVTETAKRARLPRTTAYRVLETLRLGGFVERDERDLYRATEKSRGLAAAPSFRAPVVNGHSNGADGGHGAGA